METCTYDLDHSAVAATHYYRAYEGDRVNLCLDCANRFGYPQYLVEYPRPWRPEFGYLVTVLNGEPSGDELPEIYPMDGNAAEFWLDLLGCKEVDYLLADAAWEPYRPHYSEHGGVTYEAQRVTCLPVVQVTRSVIV
ncbi:hypothetical protein PV708_02640 [Streptomyces sp. ME02-6977A]|uniref:hypothetical protein n=1 Tax=Streptomyces sp. ME02-6977A TaxID=3028671 RepID=UPI0029B42B06|nr:hypothetical protein [Streptomyces sp. ME02-6977A]MDX3405137.1 hypothetical protein [Streptomyces sp. ME02-6977A]